MKMYDSITINTDYRELPSLVIRTKGSTVSKEAFCSGKLHIKNSVSLSDYDILQQPLKKLGLVTLLIVI